MTTVSVLHRPESPSGGAPRTMTAELIATSFYTDDGTATVLGIEYFEPDAAGLVTLRLRPNSEMAQTGTYYRVRIARSSIVYCAVVPDAGPVQLVDILVDPDTLNPVTPPLPTLFQLRSEQGQPNGYPSLDGTGKVPAAQLPVSGGGVPSTRLVAAGTGLQGGGDLSTDRTLSLSAGSQASLVLADSALQPTVVDAAGDLLVGTGPDAVGRLALGSAGQIPTVSGGALVYADPRGDPGSDTLGLYGFHSATADLSAFRSEFGQNNEIWIGRILVRAGRAVESIATFVKTAGVLGAGGTNGFALATDDGSALLWSVDNDNLWASSGLVSVSLGASSIPAQSVDVAYRAQLSVQGYATPPSVLLNQGDHAVLSDYQGRARFANASAGYQGGGGYNPVTFGTSTGGFYPCIMLGEEP